MFIDVAFEYLQTSKLSMDRRIDKQIGIYPYHHSSALKRNGLYRIWMNFKIMMLLERTQAKNCTKVYDSI